MSGLQGYTEVADRIAMFYERYPEGSIRTESVEFLEVDGKSAVLVRSACYRTPGDPTPSSGTAMELIPGKNKVVAGSEVEVCETSSWGRSLAALGLGGKVASADELRAKGVTQASQKPDTITASQAKSIAELAAEKNATTAELRKLVAEVMGKPVNDARMLDLTLEQAAAVTERLAARS